MEIEEGIEGWCIFPRSVKSAKSSTELYNAGDIVSAVSKASTPEQKKIRLSIKEMEAPPQTAAPTGNQYINNRENIGSTLAQALADVKISPQPKE